MLSGIPTLSRDLWTSGFLGGSFFASEDYKPLTHCVCTEYLQSWIHWATASEAFCPWPKTGGKQTDALCLSVCLSLAHEVGEDTHHAERTFCNYSFKVLPSNAFGALG